MKELKPLKDMPREEAHRIFDAWLDGETITRHCTNDVTAKGFIALYASETYSIPVTYPEVPWDLIDEKWNFYAVNERGLSMFYTHDTERIGGSWVGTQGEAAISPLKINNGTCHWTESKVRRPE